MISETWKSSSLATASSFSLTTDPNASDCFRSRISCAPVRRWRHMMSQEVDSVKEVGYLGGRGEIPTLEWQRETLQERRRRIRATKLQPILDPQGQATPCKQSCTINPQSFNLRKSSHSLIKHSYSCSVVRHDEFGTSCAVSGHPSQKPTLLRQPDTM